MISQLESSVVRIHTPDGTIVGAGFLVGERRVLTCAHVVAIALGVQEGIEGTLADKVLDLPLVEPGHRLNARVIHWDTAHDVAGLELMDAPSADARPVHLLTSDDLWGHAFRAFGFPSGYEDGVWTSGVLRGRTAAGWVQIEDVKEPGYWVQPGFSGTPVWDEQLDGVVGMAVAADTDRATKAAFMIPAQELIEAWPELAKTSLEAGSLGHLQMQLARLGEAQRKAADPSRFQHQIDALQKRIATWDGRVERQRERIAEGLEAQRQQMAEERARRREKERLRVVGQPPLGVADYFKDRERDLQKLRELMTEPTTRLVSVIGHGGMGKTALACRVLEDLERHRWPHTDREVPVDGIVYLSTRTAGISLERLFLDCARLLGGENQERLNAVWTNPQLETKEKIARLLQSLSDGRYVILLDNLEDLLNDQGRLIDDDLRRFFDQALTTARGAQLVVTSRVALAFRREVMRFDRQVKLLEGLPVGDGVALLRELDPNGDYGLRDALEGQLAEAVKLTHGVPRALEVLAGILANDPFATLDEVLETFYEQEDVVQALIEENYKRLDRETRRVIEALAVFRRPVPPLAVDYLLEPFAPGLDVPGILRRLTRTNIVSVDRAAKTVTLHPIDQDYAYSQLPEEGTTESSYTRQALERRAADYYIQLRTPEETWKSIDDLEPQLNEFEHRVRAGDYDGATRVLEPIDSEYLFLWGHYERLVKMREQIVLHLSTPDLQMECQSRLGLAYHSLGQFAEAIECHQAALTIAQNISNRKEAGRQIGYLGKNYHFISQIQKATELYEEALSIARETGDRRYEGVWLGYLGYAHRILGQLEQSVDELRGALVIARDSEIRDRAEEGRHLGNLGSSYRNLGYLEQATKCYKEALIIVQELGYRRYEGIWLGSLGAVCRDLGQFRQAINFCQAALQIASEMGDQRHESMWLGSLGVAYRGLGHLEQARECFEEALAITRNTTGERLEESAQLSRLGRIYGSQENWEQAIECYEGALTIAQDINDRLGESYHLLGLSLAWLIKGVPSKACQHCKRAYELDMPRTSYLAALALGTVYLHQKDPNAVEFFSIAATKCRAVLSGTVSSYESHYTLATALVGEAVCDPRWADESERPDLLAPALTEYRRALEITAAPGVVQDALRDLELIRAAGTEGLEPVFELLESAEYEPDEVSTDIVEE